MITVTAWTPGTVWRYSSLPCHSSLDSLQRLLDLDCSVPGPCLLLLLAQHSTLKKQEEQESCFSSPWSTPEHQELAKEILSRLEGKEDGGEEEMEGVTFLLVKEDRKLLGQTLQLLQVFPTSASHTQSSPGSPLSTTVSPVRVLLPAPAPPCPPLPGLAGHQTPPPSPGPGYSSPPASHTQVPVSPHYSTF